MPRPREFDTEAVVEQAMGLFWRRGYAATSMADIYAATGLKPGSLYGAFGDKEALFRQAFEAYVRHFRQTLPAAEQGVQAIESWLYTQARLASEDPQRRGCLIINTALEREAHSPATQALAQGRVQEIRDYLLHHLGLARASGAVPPSPSAEAQADALLGTVFAVMAMGRAGADASALRHVVQAATVGLRHGD